MTSINDLDPVAVRDPDDFKRDKNGTPSVSDPTGATVKSGARKDEPKWVKYGRPSNFGQQIENTYNLVKWGERRIVLGLGLDGDLRHAAFELVADDGYPIVLWEQAADSIVKDAKQVAKANEAGEQGTHAHVLTQDDDEGASWLARLEAGEDLGIPAEAQRSVVAAWRMLLQVYGLEVLAVESKVVNDEHRQAGTLDRIVRLSRDLTFTVEGEIVTLRAGSIVILDIKSGKLKLDYWNGYAVQIYVYASGVPYDTRTEARGEWEWTIDQRWALIAHLPVADAIDGEPKARLVLVDLEKGKRAAELCRAAKEWENDRAVFGLGLDIEFVTPETGSLTPAEQVLAAAPRPSSAQVASYLASATKEPTWRATMPDESELMADPVALGAKVTEAYMLRTPESRAIIDALLKDAQRAGVPFGQLAANPTVRRFEAARVAFRIADHLGGPKGADEELARAAIRLVIGDKPEVEHAPLGALVGCLTVAEARQLCTVLEDVGAGLLVADYTDGPALRRAA